MGPLQASCSREQRGDAVVVHSCLSRGVFGVLELLVLCPSCSGCSHPSFVPHPVNAVVRRAPGPCASKCWSSSDGVLEGKCSL